MKVVYKNLPANRKECVAAIGVFDGVHLGHQFLLKKVKEEAKRLNVSSLLITFDTPPKLVLNKNFGGWIIDIDQKKNLIASLGIDYLWFLKTNSSFLKLSGKEFIIHLIKYFEIKEFIVGDDFRFGYKGESDTEQLIRIGQKHSFKVKVLKKKRKRAQTISSSLIRKFIKTGNFQKVKMFLGRDYCLKGNVHKGLGLGRKLGIPTANINAGNYVYPHSGVYAAQVMVGSRLYPSAVNIGFKPTVTDIKKEVLEVHIIGFNKHILGKTITVFFLEKIREEKKFSSLEELKDVISKDILYIRSRKIR